MAGRIIMEVNSDHAVKIIMIRNLGRDMDVYTEIDLNEVRNT